MEVMGQGLSPGRVGEDPGSGAAMLQPGAPTATAAMFRSRASVTPRLDS